MLKFSSIKPNWDFMQTVNNKWDLHYLVEHTKLQRDPARNEEHSLEKDAHQNNPHPPTKKKKPEHTGKVFHGNVKWKFLSSQYKPDI